ncbi:uncharacterized protein METZ01_LOCUS311180, partial [marine metagenome]
PFPPEVLSALYTLSETVVEEEAAKSELGKKIYGSYKGFRDSIAKYHNITERAYINARHRD